MSLKIIITFKDSNKNRINSNSNSKKEKKFLIFQILALQFLSYTYTNNKYWYLHRSERLISSLKYKLTQNIFYF